MALLESLGFREKFQWVPSQQIHFRFQVDSENMNLFLPEDKMEQIIQMCQSLMSQQTISLRSLFSATYEVTTVVLEPPKIQSLIRSSSYDNLVTLDPPSMEELMWWSTQLHLWNGRDVCPKVPDMIIDTDVSLTGWGIVCAQGGSGIQGRGGSITYCRAPLQCSPSWRIRGTYSTVLPTVMSAGWGDLLPKFYGISLWPMAVVPSEEHKLMSRVSTRSEQLCSRQGVLPGSDIRRMEATQEGVILAETHKLSSSRNALKKYPLGQALPCTSWPRKLAWIIPPLAWYARSNACNSEDLYTSQG